MKKNSFWQLRQLSSSPSLRPLVWPWILAHTWMPLFFPGVVMDGGYMLLAFALLLVLLCAVCPSACQGSGFPRASFPTPPLSFLCSACLLFCPLACFLLVWFSLSFPRCFVVAGCPCSLPSPLPPLMCANPAMCHSGKHMHDSIHGSGLLHVSSVLNCLR